MLTWPPIVASLRGYSVRDLRRDAVAGLTVAIVAIPQSMAYAIIAGVDVVYGLYAAVIGTVIASLFGSSRHLIAGPTNAMAMLVASTMHRLTGLGGSGFYETLFVLTFLVGVLQLAFGLLRLGRLVNYVSHSVVVGFTSAAGLLIAINQLPPLLGMTVPGGHARSVERLFYLAGHLGDARGLTVAIGIGAIALILLCRRMSPWIPGPLLALIVPAVLCACVPTRVAATDLIGAVPAGWPAFRALSGSVPLSQDLVMAALALAVMGLVEPIAIAKSIAVSSRQKVDANQQFVAQGLSNGIGAWFQCFAGSGSYTRSAINHQSGAVTQLSGILSGLIVGLALVGFGPYARYIPQAGLAGVIMVIALGMLRPREMRRILVAGKTDAAVLVVTFVATLALPHLDQAIYVGVATSVALFLKNTDRVPLRVLEPVADGAASFEEKDAEAITAPQDVLVLQVEGNLYFGSAHDLEDKLEGLAGKARAYVVRMKRVAVIDLTAAEVLRRFVERAREEGAPVVLCGVSPRLRRKLERMGLVEAVGSDHVFNAGDAIFASLEQAVAHARVDVASGSAEGKGTP